MADQPIFEKKNILVTGGAGFIGSFLCERLLKHARVIFVPSDDPEKIETLRWLFRTYAHTDTGLRALADELNRRGIAGPTASPDRSRSCSRSYLGLGAWAPP